MIFYDRDFSRPFTDAACPRGAIKDTSNSTTPHDRLFKQLLATFIYEFIELFLPDLAKLVEPDSLFPLDKELFATPGTGTRRESDLVYKPMAPVEQEAILELTNSWVEKGIEQERQRTEQERQRIEQEYQRAEQERDAEYQRLSENERKPSVWQPVCASWAWTLTSYRLYREILAVAGRLGSEALPLRPTARTRNTKGPG